MCDAVKKAIVLHLGEMLELPLEELLRRRTRKYCKIGVLGGE
jgi:hypothetical protein